MNDQQAQLFRSASRETSGPVECLGMTFSSDAERRGYFTEKLREKLGEPEFRKAPGFPEASDEDILLLSDPPYYTACPNPFLDDFVRQYGKPYDPNEEYRREPFAVDVSVGKTDQLYRAHGYHTKVPHLAIVPSILHYTRPGDLVLDGFCGSGLTGVAAQWCGTAPHSYRRKLESDWKRNEQDKPVWGGRRAVLADISPAASFIAAGFNLPFDAAAFHEEAQRILHEVEEELGWMYATTHEDGRRGRINYTVWSEIFSCPECAAEVNFFDEALNTKTGKTRSTFYCPACGAELDKDSLERIFEAGIDRVTGEPWRRIKLEAVLLNYNVGSVTYEKALEDEDRDILKRIDQMDFPPEVPATAFPIDEMYHGSRIEPKGFSHVHHLFLPRAAHALAALWRKCDQAPDASIRRMLRWFVEQGISSMSALNRYKPLQHGRIGGSQVNNQMSGIYYIASLIPECAPWYVLHDPEKRSTKLTRLVGAFGEGGTTPEHAMVSTGDCAKLALPECSIDYVFTDPPFGENIPYSDLNIVVESWHRVLTNTAHEAIIDKAKNKGLYEYQEFMRACFAEYCRVLKPGRWMTVVFSNSSNAIWRAIQEAMGTAGFVVADVRTLDKKQGSYRQVTSSAVKQDLVISAYKPRASLTEKFQLGAATRESAWAFVNEHLRNVPVFVGRAGEADLIVERTPQMLLDRMIAFHVQRGVAVPIGGPEFFAGLAQRYPEREGMYFLSEQVAEYDRKRTKVAELRQLSLFVTDEASAIQWVRQQLQRKPQSFQDLQPQFMRELKSWAKHEETVELRVILEQNFLRYDGDGPVPSQIHSHLSSNHRDLRNREKDDAELVKKAKGRWYVPDPNKQSDLEKLRERALLREFEDYKTSKQRRLKQFRTEAVRVGFKAAYDSGDYETIVSVAGKIPDKVLQEDEKLLMYFDVASMRLGGEE